MLLPRTGKTPASQPSIGLFRGGQTAGVALRAGYEQWAEDVRAVTEQIRETAKS
jgi:hypothetical protein